MTKRLIEIDDRLLESAQVVLGTQTYKDTVSEALERVVAERSRARDDVSAVLKSFARATTDLSDPEVMDAAWR